LRPLAASDLPTCLPWVNDPEITRFTGTLEPISMPEHEAWLARLAGDPTWRGFAIETRMTARRQLRLP